MLTLYTGAPGAGKTLKMLNDHLASADGSRPIYVHGVEGLVPSDKWLPLENPHDWAKLPYGSLVLIDEAQTVFRPRRPGDPLPDYVSAAETHRHLGIDLIMTTQYPMLIDAHIRRLCSDHQHLVNVWGLMGRSSVFQWDEVQDDPKDPRSRKLARKFMFKYPKAVFDLYKSAQIHTKKPRTPKWFKYGFPALVFLVGFAGWFGFHTIENFAIKGNIAAKAASPGLVSTATNPIGTTENAARQVGDVAPASSTPFFKRPLSHFDAYSVIVRNRQALKLPAVSDKFRLVGYISGPDGHRSYVIQSRSGAVHTVPAIRCTDFEGLEVCRWGGGYVSSRPGHPEKATAPDYMNTPLVAPTRSPAAPVVVNNVLPTSPAVSPQVIHDARPS